MAKIPKTIQQQIELLKSRNMALILEFFILKHIDNHGFATRTEIDQLLIDKLPDFMTLKQRKKKIDNLLQAMKSSIRNVGTRTDSKWVKIRKG